MVEITYPCRRLSDLPAEWGQVIQTPVGQATFRSDSFSYWDGIAPLAIQGEAGIGWFDLQRRPFRGSEVERHRFTPEALLCFRGAAACVVGPDGDSDSAGAGDRPHRRLCSHQWGY